MIPSVFTALDALPVSANGKLQRAALPAPRGYRWAQNVLRRADRHREGRLQDFWSDVLGAEPTSPDTTFFGLGDIDGLSQNGNTDEGDVRGVDPARSAAQSTDAWRRRHRC